MKKLYSLVAVAMLSTAAYSQTVLLSDDFSSITTGNDTSSSGSSTIWTGDANFPVVNKAYQAGGAVKLGTGTVTGSITSMPLDLSTEGGAFSVEFDVKGWTTVEGQIKVDVTGLASQTYTYSATMSGGAYESVKLTFTGGQANSTITIGTTAKRAFIDNVKITTIPVTNSTIEANANKKSLVKNTVVANELMFAVKANVKIYDMNGKMVKAVNVNEETRLDVSALAKGMYIVTGEVEGQKVSQKIIKK